MNKVPETQEPEENTFANNSFELHIPPTSDEEEFDGNNEIVNEEGIIMSMPLMTDTYANDNDVDYICE